MCAVGGAGRLEVVFGSFDEPDRERLHGNRPHHASTQLSRVLPEMFDSRVA
jgi:hypothetical protein